MSNMAGFVAATRRKDDGKPYNTSRPIVTPTYDGSGCTVHPDVIDFNLHGMQDWNGWRYWMAHTPYPAGSTPYENPSILVSEDGITWQLPAGAPDPLYDFPGAEIGYQSDTDMAYDPDEDGLVLVWRTGGSVGTHLIARSPDGVTWPAAGANLNWNPVGGERVCPTLLREDDGTWSMWSVRAGTRAVARWSAATPEGPWGSETTCTGFGPLAWHMDIVKADGLYYSLMMDRPAVGPLGPLHALTSRDGLTWKRDPAPLIVTGTNRWDNLGVYRPTIQPHEDGKDMRVWYSGFASHGNLETSWRVGHVIVPLREWPSL